ncbi:hypothetical protein BDU57DRAFT_498123 [Ampelomyces quisqualis]|uniref:GAR domain-containing protein n=1 Tax=Ampelomyces quisqualis TaxID=50730 RepID=A0A6A5QNM3_AMPQU|nr:hypothetical protein BDU57DRAFT_498123 [Ampelomyces quisqualis]
MATLSSPLRLAPPLTPCRAPSPIMSPGGRRGRLHTSEETRLRDLSPATTLRAFTQRPLPFDTTCDDYKIFACIDTLTAAERDLGARVAKAAQRLKSWCTEIEQWGWSGSFEPPSREYREQRRKSLELRIREFVGDADSANALAPLDYWGSLLSVEVEAHEARLDDMEEEMLKLDVEELKEHVLDMHPSGRSRPSSAGFEAPRQNYTPIDDFSILITQTLLSALPHHAQLKDRLSTWTARISILREVPRYLDHLSTAQKAMRLGWDAIEPPADTSDEAFVQWKAAVDTIAGVLGSKISDLGKQLDRMLDTLEGRDDCIPDAWIDTFEGIETDHGRWSHESRRKVMDFELRRRWEQKGTVAHQAPRQRPDAHASTVPAAQFESASSSSNVANSSANVNMGVESDATNSYKPNIVSPGKFGQNATLEANIERLGPYHNEPSARADVPDPSTPRTPRVLEFSTEPASNNSTPSKKPWFMTDKVVSPATSTEVTAPSGNDGLVEDRLVDMQPAITSTDAARKLSPLIVGPIAEPILHEPNLELQSPVEDEESDFDEGDTVIHNDMEHSPEAAIPVQALSEPVVEEAPPAAHFRHRLSNLSESPVMNTNDDQTHALPEPPQTPRSRRDSEGSVSSTRSLESSPPSYMEDSPSVRNTTNRSLRAPRPELNAAMAKRRLGKTITDDSIASAPWPPTQFSQKNSAEDLERKISDILTTIPAHIRLTSGPGADAPEIKPTRGLATKGSRTYLRAARSVSGLKSPELTLSPAKNDFDSVASGRKSAAASRVDNDIKLYHLTQPGKEQPVKLFIRRVGEYGERVMVRVGGGWADLGEYLRQYAEHHGRRTASDGKFEVLGLEVNKSDAMNSPKRPESAMSKHDRRVSSGRPTASPLTTPTKTTVPGLSNDDAVPPMPNFAGTPGISEEATIPSTNSSQRSWTGNEVGLAGPKARKLDLSGEKLEWVEGMMKQARTVSGSVMTANQNNTPRAGEERVDSRSESRSDSRAYGKKPEFGDLGKIGGTKRIFLRGGKPVLD